MTWRPFRYRMSARRDGRRWRENRVVLSALASAAGLDVLQQAVKLNLDRRCMIAHCAAAAGMDEGELIKKVARRLGLGTAPRLEPFDVRRLPWGLSLSDLRRRGVAAVRVAGIDRAACADPSLLDERFPDQPPPLLARWADIAGVLEQSEQLLLSQIPRTPETARRGLALIVREAASFGASEVMIARAPADACYEFRAGDGRAGKGAVEASLRDAICALRAGDVDLRAIIGPAPCTLQSDDSGLRVSWAAPAVETQRAADGALLLLVDESAVFLQVLDRFLARCGMRSISVCGARDLSQFEAVPDAIVAAVSSGEGGLALLRMCRGNERLRRVPLIALGADRDPSVQIAALDEGAEAYVAKSEDPRVLRAHLLRVLRAREAAA